MPRIRSVLAAFLFGIIFCALPFTPAHGDSSREYTIKASLVLKFPSFITWPDTKAHHPPSSPLNLCLAGDDPFGNIFQLAMEENIVDVRLSVRRLGEAQNFQSCHILYLSSLSPSKTRSILERVRNLPVLVIGEQPGLADLGAGINFLIVKNRVQFEINKSAIERSGLTVSSELLALAYRVREEK